MNDTDYDKGDWISCPECSSVKVKIEKHTEGYEWSIVFECQSCGEQNGFWL